MDSASSMLFNEAAKYGMTASLTWGLAASLADVFRRSERGATGDQPQSELGVGLRAGLVPRRGCLRVSGGMVVSDRAFRMTRYWRLRGRGD